MSQRVYVAVYDTAHDLVRAAAAVRKQDWPVVEAYTPYPVHGLDEALDRPRSRLAVAAFVCGLLGVVAALALQFWTTARDWPLNVGGQPWDSLPAFVPVTFEMMVLFAGLGLFAAWLVRCGLNPGKAARLVGEGETDNRFVLVVGEPPEGLAGDEVRGLLAGGGAVTVDERYV
jgi:hypothetical protein